MQRHERKPGQSDAFAKGWVAGIDQLVNDFTNPAPHEYKNAIPNPPLLAKHIGP